MDLFWSTVYNSYPHNQKSEKIVRDETSAFLIPHKGDGSGYLLPKIDSRGFAYLIFTLSIRFQNRKCKVGTRLQNQRAHRARHLESQIVGGCDGASMERRNFKHMRKSELGFTVSNGVVFNEFAVQLLRIFLQLVRKFEICVLIVENNKRYEVGVC